MGDLTKTEIVALKKFLEQTKVNQIMVKTAVTIFEDDELSVAEQKFVDHHINYLVVVGHDRKIVGLLSRKYLYKTLAPRKIMNEEMDYDPQVIIDGDSFYEKDTLDSYILRNIMNKSPAILRPDQSLKDALALMAERKVSCIPVVDQNQKPVGVLSHQEIISYVGNLLGF